MKTKFFVLLALVGITQTPARADSITVNFSAGLGQRNLMFNGSTVPDNNYVKVGFFNSGFDVAANAGNLTSLAGAWNELGYTMVTPVFGQPGYFGGSQSAYDPKFDAQKICMWIVQTVNNNAPTPGLDNLLGYGVFSSTSNTWVFPHQTDTPPTNIRDIYSSDIDQAFFGSFDPNHLFLSPVPEPSTYALLGTGVASFIAIRRFKKRRTATAFKS
jgi:PEP-CTERM motif